MATKSALTVREALRFNRKINLTKRIESGRETTCMKTNANTCAMIMFTCTLLLTPKSISAATWQAATAKQSDVQAAILRARDGDTVVVPATLSLPGGAAIWTSRINVTVGITIKGQTTITGAGTSNPNIVNRTVILDNSPRNTNESGLLKFSLTPAQKGRLTGFTFKAGVSNVQNNVGIVQLISSGAAANYTMRVDHCYFDDVYSRDIQVGGWCMGVADHNVMHAQGNSQCLLVSHPGYGDGGTRGDESWADYPYFGTKNFFFFEDNTIVGNGVVPTSGASDGQFGARFVIRHNDWTNARPGWHGTEGGKSRGTRCAEIYNNTSHWTMATSASYRSGNALIHDNSWDGHDVAGGPYHGNISLFRAVGAGGIRGGELGSADGRSPWDVNDTEGNGTYVQGHPPHLFDSGRASATSSGGTLKDATANWTPHQWIGYSVTNMNPQAGAYLKGSVITDNTRTTISYIFYPFHDRGPLLVFTGGDAYQIHRCLTVLDQPGRGKGDLCGGLNMINTLTGTPLWPHELKEPSFSWNNVYTLTNTAWGFGSGFPQCIEGRDFYNLGRDFPPNSTPSKVSAILTSAINGVPYNRTFTYPHPYALAP
jgi:hypothetical protein